MWYRQLGIFTSDVGTNTFHSKVWYLLSLVYFQGGSVPKGLCRKINKIFSPYRMETVFFQFGLSMKTVGFSY